MDMQALFEDYMRYLESMDTSAIQRSIQDAEAHSSDCYLLGDNTENTFVTRRSVTQCVSPAVGIRGAFSFHSIGTNSPKNTCDFAPMEVFVA